VKATRGPFCKKKIIAIVQKKVYCECLKQLAAIFLIALFSFNLAGYRAFFYYQQQQSTAAIESKIDHENYDDAELMTVRVNLNMPYQAQQTEFERVDGQIEVNGILYKYVKRKIENGQLVLLCIRDQDGTKIQMARESFFKITNSLAQDKKDGKESSSRQVIAKKLVFDFEENYTQNTIVNSLLLTLSETLTIAQPVLTGTCRLPDRPPQFA
jgi:hypothetical protein